MEISPTPASILRETVDDILANPGAAVRISVPTVAAIALTLLVTALGVTASDGGASAGPAILVALMIAGAALVVGFTWTAVAWHRHVILGEPAGALLPRWPSGHLLGYFGRSILVSLVVIAVLIVPLLIASQIAPTSSSLTETSQSYELLSFPADFSPLSIVVWAVLSALTWGVSLRAGLILPARAIGEPKTLGEVWAVTKGRFVSFFAPLGLIIAVVFAVLDLTTGVVPFGGVTELLAAWLQMMIGIGILTRLHIGYFGHTAPSLLNLGTKAD